MAKRKSARLGWPAAPAPPQERDYYLDFLRADEALRGVAERDGAVQDVLRTIRARIDQQITEVENFTRDWGHELEKLQTASAAAIELVKDLEEACKTLRPGVRKR